ncbi:zinc ribbon domain-containing protein [Paenibacillus sp.]|uniref:zinc ribbon domain-containing protein n=1 Tax=Paenibacillus sp. TaxID=58172 RepID=UPI0028123210|nr:zinc ribbon domain-containing protein [Paenibacillus sp.]
MTTILVVHLPTSRKFLLVGASTPGLAAVCDADGAMHWLPAEELKVLEYDGRPIERYRYMLEPTASAAPTPTSSEVWEDVPLEACPACETPVRPDTRECPSCGLTLILEQD